jgi:hypothetical protein
MFTALERSLDLFPMRLLNECAEKDVPVTEAERRMATERIARSEARAAGLPLPPRTAAYTTAPYPVWLAKTVGMMKRRACDARYDASDKGRTRAARYNGTQKGRKRYETYNWSNKGQEREFARYMRRLRAQLAVHRDLLAECTALVGDDLVAGIVRADDATLTRLDALLGLTP